MAAIGALSIAFLLTAELAHAEPEPATTLPSSAPASTAPATDSAPSGSAASGPTAASTTGGQPSTGTDLTALLDVIVEAADEESSEDGIADEENVGDQGTGDDAEDDTPLLEPSDEPSSSLQLATADAATTQAGPSNENATVRVGDPGDTGPVGQSNQANATADASAGVKGSKGKDEGSSDSATSQSQATTKQSKPKNTNVEVRVDSPGDIAPVGQSNTATANAGAGGGTGDVGEHEANASATQTSPQNVNVVVRVDSPGDNGGVVQTNAVSAAAGAHPQPPIDTPTDAAANGTFETDQLVTTSGSSTVANDGELVQEIDQDQGDGAPLPGLPAEGSTAGGASTTGGSATATQADALNANVSIRIDSPGADGPVRQANEASRKGPDGKVVTVSGGSNVDIALSLVSSAAGHGDLATWVWNWIWDGGWLPPAGIAADAAPTAGSVWNWLWEEAAAAGAAPPAGATAPSTSSTAGAAPAEQGFWSWTWTWILSDGSTWSLERKTRCECAWVWNWSWDWSEELPALEATSGSVDTEEAATVDAFDPATDSGPVTQTNTVTATATAVVGLDRVEEVVQSQVGSDPALELQGAWAGQRLANEQIAQAAAQADQVDALNVSVTLGFPLESLVQSNVVEAEADAASVAEVAQVVLQAQEGDGATEQWVEAEQQLANAQTSIAVALAAQTDAANVNVVWGGPADEARLAPVEQANTAEATAVAHSAATLLQWIGQAQRTDVSFAQFATATQLHANLQTALAAAVVTQTRTANLNAVEVPAGSRATNPSVRQRNVVFTDSSSVNRSVIDAWILQTQAGAADIEIQSADQQGVVEQTAHAYSPASQTDLLNRAGWLGIEPPAETSDEDGPSEDGPAPATVSSSTTLVVMTTSVRTPSGKSSGGKLPPRRGGSDRPERLHGKLTAGPGSPETPERGTPPRPLRPPASPWTGPGLGASDAPPDAAPGHSARPAEEKAGPRSSGRTHDPSMPDDACAAMLGTSGCAPLSGGSGSAVLVVATYELAAPAHLGPHVPGPILGRSVGFLEPFEWPG